jgi:asparagine synthase (glutamine-hydrolysing)
MAHSVELRVPFLDPDVIQVAFSIAPQLKIWTGNDSLGKRIHRDYCRSIGIPAKVALRAKEAAQHGADVHSAFTEIAESHGLTEQILEEAGYDPCKTVPEVLGSSSRYGHRYGDGELWKIPMRAQYYLDSRAAEMDLMGRLERFHWEQTRRKLAGRGVRVPPRPSRASTGS